MKKTKITAQLILKIEGIDEIFDRVVKSTGNSAMVQVPKKFLGRSVKLIILRDENELRK